MIPKTHNQILNALCFHALIELAMEGNIENIKPMRLYGAMLQQAFSYIASKNGTYTSVRELGEISSIHEHLTEEVIDTILLHASNKNYVKKHEYKNKYGASEGLHRLIDYNLVYSNFPMNYQEISIYHDKKEIGSIPTLNLLRLKRYDIILFAGKYWRVEKVGRKGIYVKPERITWADAKEIRYFTEGVEIDMKILNRAYEYLWGRDINVSWFENKMHEKISNFLKKSKSIFKRKTIPVFRKSNRYYHLTFAGKLCNEVISRRLGIKETESDNLGILAPEIINFSKLDSEPEKYLDVLENLIEESLNEEAFEYYSSQTIYQSLLPKEFQKKEFLDEWVCKTEHKNVLERIKESNSELFPIPYEILNMY